VRVGWATLCRYAEVNDGLATMVGAGLDTYFVPGFPETIQVVVVFQLFGTQQEMADEHELVFRIHDPAMNAAESPSVTFVGEPNPLALPGWEASTILVTAHVLPASAEGAYGIEIVVDGDSQNTVPFSVRGLASGDES